ncbi:MAG: lipoate--protein ligase family protein [Parachlamydiales bacterium]|nr:lipoate--protein ligase family protein [Parachlamydiales bacterium]
MKLPLVLLNFPYLPIEKMLSLEYFLLKNHTKNWCLITQSTSKAIVMGVSAKKKEVIHLPFLTQKPIVTIRRFSGGGTVVVDQHTFFISFIFSKKESSVTFPEEIYRWCADRIKPAFALKEFSFLENDFVIGHQKVGGNAQYITKDRWLQHTSFLWDFDKENFNYLLYPKKTPNYRQNRPHELFVTSCKKFFPSKEVLIKKCEDHIRNTFCIEPSPPIKSLLDEVPDFFLRPDIP